MATQLGPKSFTIDHLLAIFYAILDEKVGLNCNLLAQISTLIHLKFLIFASGEGSIMEGNARLQCVVGMDFIVYIGRMVGFNVRQYLCDFPSTNFKSTNLLPLQISSNCRKPTPIAVPSTNRAIPTPYGAYHWIPAPVKYSPAEPQSIPPR